MALLCASDAAAQSPLTNAGFEQDSVAPIGSPDGWALSAWIPSLVSTTLDSSVKHEGNRSLRVNLTAHMQISGGWEQPVALEANRNYLLSGWIRTENVAPTFDPFGEVGAHLAIDGSAFRTQPLVGTNDWTYVRLVFNSGQTGLVTVGAALGNVYGRTQGTAWFDDVRVEPISSTAPHPSWKILVLIYERTDLTYTDSSGTHRLVGQMTGAQMSAAAASATRFVHNDIPLLTSGQMIPRLTIRYPGTLTKASFYAGGWAPDSGDTVADRDPAFDSIIVIWQPTVTDQSTGQSRWIANAAGRGGFGIGQTYCWLVVEGATSYGHLNVLKHEWGHSILAHFQLAGTAPRPTIDNHSDGSNYVNCRTGQLYVWKDETDAAPIPNSIYNNLSGFTHDYYSGTTALVSDPTRCLGITAEAWAAGGPVSQAGEPPPVVSVSPDLLRFGAARTATAFTSKTSKQTVRLTQAVGGAATWTASTNQPWLSVSPTSGSGSGTLDVDVIFAGGLPVSGIVSGAVTLSLTGPGISERDSQKTVEVVLTLKSSSTSTAPFGVVDTPLDNTTGVTGAVPFTGWALDDLEVANVFVCRTAVAGETAPVDANCGGQSQIFVGTAVFIDGARPDVQTAFPLYTRGSRGGWGFMVLTNMLPNQGNGTYQFFMHAQDRDGHTTLLGTRTLTCANASATKPFGAIDTPTQGGPASGSSFLNFGWALTPQPKFIPITGSTITVMVDGAPLGPVDYNHERPDIETLFPGFQNTAGANGAVGFRVIDTTSLTNGLHTISWTVTDSLGVTEGIGSRFFTVANGAGAVTAAENGATRAAAAHARTTLARPEDIAAAPQDDAPVLARRGWDLEGPWRWYGVGGAMRAVIRGEEVDRFELWLGAQSGAHYTGHLRVGEALAALPAGSQLDAATGQFTWAPGAGFVGRYDLVFVRWEGTRAVARHEVRVILAPKASGHVGVQVAIDTPRALQDAEQPVMLEGWAADLDAASGTGIDALHVWAYPATGGAPVFLGTPALGGARPDVAAVHGDQFHDVGFALTVQGLAPGTYDLAVFPWSNVAGAFAPARTVRVTLRP